MQKIKLYLLLLALPIAICAYSQPYYSTYDWDTTPKHSVTDKNEELFAPMEHIAVEFSFTEQDEFVEYYLVHKVFYLNSDEAIEQYNKVYLPYDSDSKLLINKARVINPKKQIINLDDSKILTAEDEETKRSYKYFAFEGIEKGSFIEYMYVVQKSPSYLGRRQDVQNEYNKTNVEFHVLAPKNLKFKFKSYNGLAEIKENENSTTKNHWQLIVPKVEKLEKEEQSLHDAELQFLIYALNENTANGKRDITSYSTVSQNVYDFYNEEQPKKVKSKLKTFINNINIAENSTLNQKISTIENYIKTNIYSTEFSNSKLSNLESILTDKVASDSGINKLFVAILNELNIKHQIVFTCSREYMRFDKDFEANNFLQDILFYFPESKKYLAPNESESRYGYPPGYLTDTYGLFIKPVKVGDFETAIGKINYIKPIKAENSTDDMEIYVDFDSEDLTQINVTMQRSMSGYYGMYIHPYMNIIKPESKKDIVENLAKNINENIEITSSSFDNEDASLFGFKPLIFNVKFTSDAFIEKAGNKYLLKVGDLIGPQMELYQEKERELPLENEFQRIYDRTITITIPKGYKIANLNDINIKNDYEKDGEILFSFHSYYELTNNTLKITADEFYQNNSIPVSLYEDYRRVINSAADFNKVTLVLEKE